MRNINTFLILLVLSISFLHPSIADEFNDKLKKSLNNTEEPLNIKSDKLVALKKEHKVVFSKNVILKKENATISCDELTLIYDETDKEISNIVAVGNVKIVSGDKVATGDRGEYLSSTMEFILSGNPKLLDGSSIMEGEEVVVLLNDTKIVVKEPKAVYIPQKSLDKENKDQ